MLKQSLYTKVRMECMINGKSRRQVSREYGIHRSSVDKALIHVKTPGYCRKAGIYYPVLGSEYRGFIEEVMLLDKTVLRKHHHTAKRIYDRLCDEKGYKGSYDSVKRYVFRQREKINPKEMFVPLYHPLGQAQADFGQCKVRIGGKLEKGYFFALKLCNSDDTFIMIYPSENLVSWCDGHARAFEYFGGVPNKIIYDNSKCLVKKILFNGSRELTTGFLELQSHYLFKADFCALGKGNEKGKVEGGIKYSRSNYLTPIPDCVSWEELNSYLVRRCIDRRDQKQAKQSESIGDRYLKEKSHLLPLPSDKYESFETKLVKVNSLSVVNYRTNEYSVPTEYGGCQVVIKGYHDRVVISYREQVIATHMRSYKRHDTLYNPLHYLNLIERKVRSLDQAKPLKRWDLPKEFEKLRNILESRDGTSGKREYVKVLKLNGEYTKSKVAFGIQRAIDIHG